LVIALSYLEDMLVDLGAVEVEVDASNKSATSLSPD